ncbi:hypothetical protein M1446_03635 [Candidatus Dependentiae bacterium]|nr:hypothetical protein [Candidatus Dependentiae bacterium]
MQKFFLTILLFFLYVQSMEKEEIVTTELNQDTYMEIISNALQAMPLGLGNQPSIPEINENISRISKILETRANLLLTYTDFYALKQFIDSKTIETLKNYDKRILNIFLIKLVNIKDIQDRATLGNLLVQSGADPSAAFQENQIKEFIIEALKNNDISWVEFLLNNNLNPNFTVTKTKYPLSMALKEINKYPKSVLILVKLLLDKGANPLIDIALKKDSKNKVIKKDTIFNLYAPKKEMQIKKLKLDYSTSEAAEVLKLLNEAINNIKLYKMAGLIK